MDPGNCLPDITLEKVRRFHLFWEKRAKVSQSHHFVWSFSRTLHRKVFTQLFTSIRMSLPYQVICAAAAGLFSHNVVFIHGEWHMQAPMLLRLYLSLALLTLAMEIWTTRVGIAIALGRTAAIICSYGTALLASMTLYRVIFHRLRNFPGPRWAPVSKFWHVTRCFQTGSQNHLILDDLHKKYGDFVRTGETWKLIS